MERQQSWRCLAGIADRLRARLGEGGLAGLAPQPDHRPEKSWRWVEPGTPTGCTDERPRPTWLLPEPRPCRRDNLRLEDGPERIEAGWWDEQDCRRDYFVARDRHGRRLWVFHEHQPRLAPQPDHRPEKSWRWVEPGTPTGCADERPRPTWLLPEPRPCRRDNLRLEDGPERIERSVDSARDIAQGQPVLTRRLPGREIHAPGVVAGWWDEVGDQLVKTAGATILSPAIGTGGGCGSFTSTSRGRGGLSTGCSIDGGVQTRAS